MLKSLCVVFAILAVSAAETVVKTHQKHEEQSPVVVPAAVPTHKDVKVEQSAVSAQNEQVRQKRLIGGLFLGKAAIGTGLVGGAVLSKGYYGGYYGGSYPSHYHHHYPVYHYNTYQSYPQYYYQSYEPSYARSYSNYGSYGYGGYSHYGYGW